MSAFFRRYRVYPPFLIVASILALLAAIYLFRIDALLWYYWHNSKQTNIAATSSLRLKDYHVEIDGLAIPELSDASDLTYNPATDTLFTVLNQSPYIVELSKRGEVLRKIFVEDVGDMEGITHVADNRFVIADEGDNRLIKIELPHDGDIVQTRDAAQLKLGMDARGNQNIEGVSWDSHQRRLLVVKEKNPKRLMEVRGFIDLKPDEPANLSILNLDTSKKAVRAMRDLSSVAYHDDSGHLLLLSDESRLLKEYDRQGRAIGAMALWKGFHGLRRHVPQAEGIAVGPDNRIYIMSEPNLLYVFKPVNKL